MIDRASAASHDSSQGKGRGRAMAMSTCEIGGRFRHCKQPAEHTCQYCGKSFCAVHAHRVEGYEAICAREACVAKDEDLKRHLEYREASTRRNRAGHCAEADCTNLHPGMTCSMCQGLFCPTHVSSRMYPVREGYVTINRPRSVCTWCWERRRVWRKR
jgi:hypothetical protein